MSGPLFDYGREQAGRAPRAGDALELARRAGVLSALDRQFANRLCALLGESEAGVRWAAALGIWVSLAGAIVISYLWLAIFARGPIETLLRRITAVVGKEKNEEIRS